MLKLPKKYTDNCETVYVYSDFLALVHRECHKKSGVYHNWVTLHQLPKDFAVYLPTKEVDGRSIPAGRIIARKGFLGLLPSLVGVMVNGASLNNGTELTKARDIRVECIQLLTKTGCLYFHTMPDLCGSDMDFNISRHETFETVKTMKEWGIHRVAEVVECKQ